MARGNVIATILGLGALAGAGYLLYKNWDRLFPKTTLPPSPDPCAGMTCPTGYVCRNGQCVSISAPPTDPCAGVTCPTGYVCKNGQCIHMGTAVPFGKCGSICKKYPFSSDGDVVNYIDRWVKQGDISEAEIQTILDCWVKYASCNKVPQGE